MKPIKAQKSSSLLDSLDPASARYAGAALSKRTRRAYRDDWDQFCDWCTDKGYQYLPAQAETIAEYISAMADDGRKVSTIKRKLAALSQAHQLAGHPSPTHHPTVRHVFKGIRNEIGTATQKAAPALTDDIRAMVGACDLSTLKGLRDRALVLIGFAGAFRSDELVHVDMEHVEKTRDGLIITVPRSKTDQEGQGRIVGIHWGQHPETCPRRALEAWTAAADISRGPIFRGVNRHNQVARTRLTTRSVADIVKRLCEDVGLDPARYSSHSLRAGFVTQAAMANVDTRDIMNQTAHRSEATIRGYVRYGSVFHNNASDKLGL